MPDATEVFFKWNFTISFATSDEWYREMYNILM